jgi:eukaryotic-like serine/threonine-protein kinase
MTTMLQATSPRQMAAEIMKEWERGVEPDAAEALARQPELRTEKVVVLDLACTEYCLRVDAGQMPEPEAFSDRFPTYRMSVRRIIAAHELCVENLSALAAPPIVRWPAPGERLDDFTVLRELGRGSFARVYLALEESAGDRPVALKLSPGGAAEARTLGRLAHPNVVPVLSARFIEGSGQTAVCMPFLGTATLTDVLDRAYPTQKAAPPRRASVIGEAIRTAAHPDDPAPLGLGARGKLEDGPYVDGVVRLAAQIADALTFLHKEGVCHRDLKPSNVLLSPDGQALLLDFNLSADARADAPRLGGTLPYMAPEQLRTMGREFDESAMDERVDLFALGAVLYELLTGKYPFGRAQSGQSPAAAAASLLRRQQKGCIPLRSLNPAVDRGLARLIESCLAFDPAARPASAAVLAAGFHHYLGLPARLSRAAARRPMATAALAALLLLGVGGAARELAMQDPADVRAYKEGRTAFVAGDYARAEKQFDEALRDCSQNQGRRKYLLARGAAALRQAEADDDFVKFNSAQADFVEVNKQQGDGPTLARIGYCSSRLHQHEMAIKQYDEAVKAGFASAGLYNDRGFSEWKTSDFERTRQDLDAALQADPNLQAALYNRALFSLRGRERFLVDPPPIPESALEDMRRAVEIGPEDGVMYRYAAEMYAYAARDDLPLDRMGRAAQSLSYLRKACACGENAQSLEDLPTCKAVLSSFPEFQSLRQAPQRPIVSARNLRLIDPAPYLPE